MTTTADSRLWLQTLARARHELAELSTAQREWLSAQVARIGVLQVELDRLFHAIDGPAICTDCLGGCCSLAKHHLTLTNVLAYLLDGEDPPQPDYSLPCPMLGDQGCRLPAARRPFNCIIFLCEAVDRQLSSEHRDAFTRVEAELRTTYHAIAERCPGASLRGLLIAATRLGDRPLLTQVHRR
jgi:hypothetical protein